MKITKTRLKEIIKEEVAKILEGTIPYKRDADIESVKVEEVIEEEDLEETSELGAGAVAGPSGPIKKVTEQ